MMQRQDKIEHNHTYSYFVPISSDDTARPNREPGGHLYLDSPRPQDNTFLRVSESLLP